MADNPPIESLGKLDPDAIRLGLMISSLYLFAFELLRSSIVDGVRSHFVPQGEYSQNEIQEMEHLDAKMKEIEKGTGRAAGHSAIEAYRIQLGEFKTAVGEDFGKTDNYLLVPCSSWIEAEGGLSSGDVSDIKRIRDHRNQIAHEMPKYLFQTGHDIYVDLLFRTAEILRNVDLFWLRRDIIFNPDTFEEIDISAVPDDEIFSGRDAFLTLATRAVVDFAEGFTSQTGE